MAAAPAARTSYCWKLAWDWAPLLKRRGQLHEVAGRAAHRGAGLRAPPRRPGRPRPRALRARPRQRAARRLRGRRVEHLTLALELFTELGRPGQRGAGPARPGAAARPAGPLREALDHAVEALRLRRAFAAQRGGRLLGERGRLDLRAPGPGSRGAAGTAAGRWRCTASRAAAPASPTPWTAWPTPTARLADYGQAIAHYEQALDMYRLHRRPAGPGRRPLITSATCSSPPGCPHAARRSWEQALALLTQIPGADTGEVRGRLAQPRRPRTGPGCGTVTTPARRSVLTSLGRPRLERPCLTMPCSAGPDDNGSLAPWGRGADAGHAQPCACCWRTFTQTRRPD